MIFCRESFEHHFEDEVSTLRKSCLRRQHMAGTVYQVSLQREIYVRMHLYLRRHHIEFNGIMIRESRVLAEAKGASKHIGKRDRQTP